MEWGNQMQPSKSAITGYNSRGLGLGKIEVSLLAGLKDREEKAVSKVMLEPLKGRDEECLVQFRDDQNLAAWVTGILAEKALIQKEPMGSQLAARLTVADRDLLILFLRMLTFGPEIRGITSCSHVDCNAKLDFHFDLNTLTIPCKQGSELIRSAAISQDSKIIRFAFREPDGRDQESIAGLSATNPSQAWLALLAGCIVEWDGRAGISTQDLAALPEDMLATLDQTIADEMQSLDWEIELACSECGRNFKRTLDIQAFFWQELQFCNPSLWEEVHQLAFYYHWSEDDILSLTRSKRKLYLDYIRKEMQEQA
jgi:hypothetical protein